MAPFTLIQEMALDEALVVLEERIDPSLPLEQQLETAIFQFTAAKRALGIVNKLSPGETKSRHSSRVMRLLNALRATMSSLSKSIDQMQGGVAA